MGLYVLFLNLGKNARAVEGGRCDCLLSRCPLPMFRQNSVYCMYMWYGCWEYPSYLHVQCTMYMYCMCCCRTCGMQQKLVTRARGMLIVFCLTCMYTVHVHVHVHVHVYICGYPLSPCSPVYLLISGLQSFLLFSFPLQNPFLFLQCNCSRG